MTFGQVDTRKLMIEQIELATPAERLTLLWDRLTLNLEQAAEAMDAGDHETANNELLSAQQILVILSNTLDHNWPPADDIDRVYQWAWGKLVAANIGSDKAALDEATGVLTELAAAWTKAAAQETQGALAEVG